MAISTSSRVIALTSATEYINLPVTPGISPKGYWYTYKPANAQNSALGASFKLYQWGDTLPQEGGAERLTMEGTFPLITETWNSATNKYHGGTIEWIGPGKNDITNVEETDAIFFAHLGSTTATNDAFYWDRAFLPAGGSEWEYYQYHAHSPTSYVTYENGRQVFSGDGWIDPGDKAFGYSISTDVKVSGVNYTSNLARIHTPSVGGAHNSHNDVTLPSTSNRSYMPGGILRGIGERYHAFYITSSTGGWSVFNRTYADASASFSAEVNLGIFNLASPSFNRATGLQTEYPIRASCGTSFGAKIYFPVILNSSTTSTFNLEIWSFNSLDTIAGGSLQRQVLITGSTIKPDAYCALYGTELMYVLRSSSTGGVRLHKFDGTTWTDEGLVVSDQSAKIRVHGFEFNSNDFKFYALLSGTTATTTGTYVGPGMYSFELDDPFLGYKHLDYDATNNALVRRNALSTGYVKYNTLEANFARINEQEPRAIANDIRILDYDAPGYSFYNKRSVAFGAKDFYRNAIILQDGRRFAVGQVIDNAGNLGPSPSSDFLFSLYSSDLSEAKHFAWGGAGSDFFTGVWKSQTENKIWLTGYTKSEIVPKGDVKIHGWARSLTDGSNTLEWKDLTTDSEGNVYLVGIHDTGLMVVAKYDKNYVIVWQKSIGDGVTNTDRGLAISCDSSGNVYVCGSTEEDGEGLTDALLLKLTSTGELVYAKTYGTAAEESANGMAIINKSGTEYVAMGIVSGNTSTIMITSLDGTVVEQNTYSNLRINRIRPNQSTPTGGRFLFAGNYFTATDWQGVTYSITNQGTNNYVWNGGSYVDISDPSPVTLYRGATYYFNMNAAGHPFFIKTVQSVGTGSQYTSGVTNNGATTGTITFAVPLDAPSTLYYVCQFHSGMAGTFSVVDNPTAAKFGMCEILSTSTMIQWVRTYSGSTSTNARDIVNIDAADISGQDAGYVICGIDNDVGFVLKTIVDETAGSYTVTKDWAKTLVVHTGTSTCMCGLYSLVASNYTETERSVWVVGATDIGNVTGMGMEEGVITKWSNTGTLVWQNVFGHDMDEQLVSVVQDVSGENIISCGWSESHSSSRDAVMFRCWKEGFGTGLYTLEDVGTMPYYYSASNLATNTNTNTVNSVSTPANSAGSLVSASYAITVNDSPYSNNNFNGSYGPNGLFNFVLAYVDLDLLQTYINSSEFKDSNGSCNSLNYISDWNLVGKVWVAATVGDGSADDGNIFGYDVIEGSDGIIYAIGQTSGNLSKTNTGAAGVYDYLFVEFDPATETFEWEQNGTANDEETYALTELADGTIAFTGRTTGDLGAANIGGYDIFLGIYSTSTGVFRYYSTGTGLDDKGVNIHSLNTNTLAITYTTFGALNTATNAGSEDLGIVLFNYKTNTWGEAYQVGSATSEFIPQNGKPSALLTNGRIAIAASSAGIFADDAVTYGFLDVCLAIFNTNTKDWKKFQIGTAANEITSSVTALGDTLLITGNSGGNFSDDVDAIFVEFDGADGMLGRSTSI